MALDFLGKKKDAILNIEGMHCENCVNKIKSALKAIGVNADIDLSSGKAKINYPEKLDLSKIISAVSALGFGVKEDK